MFNGMTPLVRNEDLSFLGEVKEFTPTFSDAFTGGNTSTTGTGYYTKIGKTVFFNLLMSNIDTTGLTSGNDAFIIGLPFDCKNENAASCPLMSSFDTVTHGEAITARMVKNSNALYFRHVRDGASDLPILVSDFSTGVSDVWISGFYFTD